MAKPPREPALDLIRHDAPGRHQAAQRVTWVSVLVNIALTVAQLIIGVLAHAHSLVADGFHSLSDLLSDFMVLAANHQSQHPADANHPYGHQRIETLASLALGLLLVMTGAGILWTAAERLQNLSDLPPIAPVALWVALITLLAKEGLFRYMLHVGERLRSPLLVANAWHARSDAASSLVVAVGIGGSLLGWPLLDPLAAILVGFMILRMGARFTHEATRELIDTAPSAAEVSRLRDTLRTTEGVVGLHELRTRRMAQQILADAHIQVGAHLSVSEGHHIAEQARQRVLAAHPEVLDVLVHVDAEADVPWEGAVQQASADTLPGRAHIESQLQALLQHLGLPAAVALHLHYLANGIEVELILPATAACDPGQLDELGQRLLAQLPALRSVSLHQQLHARKRGP